MSTDTSNIAKSATPTNTNTFSPTITLGFIALQRTSTEHVGEMRKQTRHSARLVPIRVRSIATDDVFVPLAEEITLSADAELVDVIFRPVRGADVVLPEEKGASSDSAPTLEFTPARIPAFGLVRTRGGKLVLADLDGEISLPADSELVGAISAPVGTHALDVYDRSTDEMYRLGYSFPNTIQPDWIQLALDRRQQTLADRAAERREREAERRAEMEEAVRVKKEKLEREANRAKPAPTFATADKEVVYQMQEAYAAKYLRRIEVSRSAPDQPYLVEDPETFGPAIAEGIAAKREELGAGADAHFERERDAREYAASLQR
jgi:hypothetical protein